MLRDQVSAALVFDVQLWRRVLRHRRWKRHLRDRLRELPGAGGRVLLVSACFEWLVRCRSGTLPGRRAGGVRMPVGQCIRVPWRQSDLRWLSVLELRSEGARACRHQRQAVQERKNVRPTDGNVQVSVDATHRFRPAPAVHARRFDEDLVLLDLRAGQYYGLDAVGAEIWDRLATGKNATEIARELVHEFEAELSRIEGDVCALAATLLSHRLIEPLAP